VVLENDGEDSYIDGVRNEVILQSVKEDRNILQTIERMEATIWNVYILLRNCLLKQIIEGKIEDRMDGKTRKKT